MGVAKHLFIMGYLLCPGDPGASQGMQCLVNGLFSQQNIVICSYMHFSVKLILWGMSLALNLVTFCVGWDCFVSYFLLS